MSDDNEQHDSRSELHGRHHHRADGECGRGRGHHGHPGFGPRMSADMLGGWGGPGRARRGDVRSAILRLLSEQPMHGYQIIQELSGRSEGMWRPSAGSVYPTLQLLEDIGLVASEESDGKRVFRLTDEGRSAVAAIGDARAPWDTAAEAGSANELREATGKLFGAVRQLAGTATDEERSAAAAILTEARKKIYAILAAD